MRRVSPASARAVQPRKARSDNGHRRGGKRAGAGRPKGSQNVFSSAIKEAVIDAANDIGQDGLGDGGMRGYMRYLAVREPAVFGGMLRGVMGTQVTVQHKDEPIESMKDVHEYLARVGLALEDLRPVRFHTPEEVLELTRQTSRRKTGMSDVALWLIGIWPTGVIILTAVSFMTGGEHPQQTRLEWGWFVFNIAVWPMHAVAIILAMVAEHINRYSYVTDGRDRTDSRAG